jgi:hypothetical protein
MLIRYPVYLSDVDFSNLEALNLVLNKKDKYISIIELKILLDKLQNNTERKDSMIGLIQQ